MTALTRDSSGAHIVVIGGGIVGSSIAFHLSLRDVRVTLLDAKEPGQGASAASFAWINGRDKNPRAYHDLNRRSLDMWDRFARRLGVDVGLTWGGELRWAATDAGATEFLQRVDLLQSWGYPIRPIEADELSRLEPSLSPGRVTAASFTEIDGHVDTGKVIRACLTRATERGASIRTGTEVTGLRLGSMSEGARRVKAIVVQESTEIPCDALVLAGGPDTAELARYAQIDVPLHYTFGATIITDPVPPVFQRAAVVHTHLDVHPQMAFRQLADGSMMVHGGFHGGSRDRSLGRSGDEVEQVMAKAAQLLPALEGVGIREVRRDRRPVPDDGHPILGFASAVPNLYLAAMHSGVTLAALVGEFAAMEIVEGVRIDLLDPYRIERFKTD